MDLKTYYDNLDDKATPPKTSFIDEVMRRTGKKRATIYRWLNGSVIPDKANKEILSRITGIAVDKLYTEETEIKED